MREPLHHLATMGSAQVLRLEDKIGNFVSGKMFDALLVNVGGNDCVNTNGWQDDGMALFRKWGFMGDDRVSEEFMLMASC